MHRKSSKKNLLYIGIILLLVILMLIGGLQILESTAFHNRQEENAVITSKTIERNGIKYFPRKDITVLLFMGIDEMGPVTQSTDSNDAGEVDMLALVIFDKTNEETRVLVLNRDTMVTMPVLDADGKQDGTYYGQLALSHTFGKGLNDSCENTRTTVSDLLYGIKIDYYVSMNMGAFPLVNDAVGGVTVEVTDDFSQIDPTITMGEMTLMGQQVLNYIQNEPGAMDQLNSTPTERQKAYLKGFMEALRDGDDNLSSALAVLEQAADYVVTDCSAMALGGLLHRYAGYPIVEMISPKGEYLIEDDCEFYIDDKALDELILRLFYAEKRTQ